MMVSLRSMHFGFLISVIVAVLIIGIAREATAQGNEVECPCDFDSVRMTPGCWTDGLDRGVPEYTENDLGQERLCRLASGGNPGLHMILRVVIDEQGDTCDITVRGAAIEACDVPATNRDITPEELKACQCELLAYTTALNEGGISVSPGPPYECFDVDCRQKVLTPIPTLNEYGMIITAGVLGLLAVIGLFVTRRRKVVA